MKKVRFTQRSFINGSIVEAGEERHLPDDFPMSLHMIDVAKEDEAREAGTEYQPEGVERNSIAAVFRADLANDIVASGYMHGRSLSGQVDPAAADAQPVATRESLLSSTALAPVADEPTVPAKVDDADLNVA